MGASSLGAMSGVTSVGDRRPRPQKRQVLVDGVYDSLVSYLMSGTLESGDPVSIDSLSRDLEVSPTPIREALARIEVTGLIVREPMRGYRIAPQMSPEDFKQLMEARLLIEPYNAAAACAHRSEEMLQELRAAMAHMRAAPTGPGFGAYREFLNADARFHQTIARYAGNHFLAESLERLGAHLHRFRLFGENGVTDALLAIEEHEVVLSAIERGLTDQARKAMRRHILGVQQRANRKDVVTD
jgi:DNA-binding GntR family transcriptional regulator